MYRFYEICLKILYEVHEVGVSLREISHVYQQDDSIMTDFFKSSFFNYYKNNELINADHLRCRTSRPLAETQ